MHRHFIFISSVQISVQTDTIGEIIFSYFCALSVTQGALSFMFSLTVVTMLSVCCNGLTQFVLWMINIIWCTYTATWFFISTFNFDINWEEYRNISWYRDIVIYRDNIVSWPKYRDTYRIARSLPIHTPNCYTLRWKVKASTKLSGCIILAP